MQRTLIRGATIVTMDAELGELRDADILVEDDTIAAIGFGLGAENAEVIDGTDRIVIPGLVNAHMHTWQTALRGVAANWTLPEYFGWVHRGLATKYRPEDIHIATLAGAIGQIDVGATTLVDWCHNNPTSEYTDAGVDGLFESGIRAVFLHGSPKPDPKPGQPHFSEVPHPREEIARLTRTRFSGPDQRVTLGMAILGPHYSTLEVARQDLKLADDYGLIASMHQGGGPPKTPGGWETLIAEGRVGSNVNIVHGNDLSDELLAAMVGKGVSFSVTPEGEMTQGHGIPITGRLKALGVQPSMGVDLESLNGSDLFTTARLGLACQRLQDNMASRSQHGKIPDTCAVTTRDALSWITTEGARMLGLDHKIGSLKPGKQADLVILDASGLNLWPVNDPVSAVVMQAHAGNVESVMIAGRFVKRNGKLLGVDVGSLRARLSASADRILGELGLAAPG